MIEVVPSINVSDFTEFAQKIKLVEPYVTWAHIDVSDGVFTKHVSWHDPHELIGFKTKLKLEAHLMIDRPEIEFPSWIATPVTRIIFHQEATHSHNFLIEKIHEVKREAGVAIRPETPWLKLFPYLKTADIIQLLAINPGPSGQRFDESILHKIGHIRSINRQCIIEIDGGVDRVVARRCAQLGANILVSGRAIFGIEPVEKIKGSDIADNIAKLKNALSQETFLNRMPGKTPVF